MFKNYVNKVMAHKWIQEPPEECDSPELDLNIVMAQKWVQELPERCGGPESLSYLNSCMAQKKFKSYQSSVMAQKCVQELPEQCDGPEMGSRAT